MWHVIKKKASNNQQELQAVIKTKEICDQNFSAERLKDEFKKAMETIKRKNNFEASYAYQAEIINPERVEIWKMKANSDKNYLMLELIKGENKPGPFDHL